MAEPEAPSAGAALADLNFADLSPQEFARIVKSLSAREIDEAFRGELRLRALREVFSRMQRLFRPDGAGSLSALIRWRIEPGGSGPGADGPGGPTVFETAIADGVCTATEGASAADPRVTLTMSDAEFLKLVSGNGSPVTMFMMRKIKIAGDVGLAAGLTRLFDIPKA
jgi:SCP-2 sterol transfer family